MAEKSVPAMSVEARTTRDNPLTRSRAGVVGFFVLATLVAICVGSLPWTLASPGPNQPGRYAEADFSAALLPPSWAPPDASTPEGARDLERLETVARQRAERRLRDDLVERLRAERLPDGWDSMTAQGAEAFLRGLPEADRDGAAALLEGALPPGVEAPEPTPEQIEAATPRYLFGTDKLGRDLFIRSLAGGGISIGIGLAAAGISVFIGTLYGAIAGYVGGRADALMMRVVDILYGLPYILLVVLLAVAGDALIDEWSLKTSARQDFRVAEARTILGAEAGAVSADEARLALREDAALAAEVERRLDGVERLRPRELSQGQRKALEVVILLVAIGGVSWLTMARVIRGQVLSLKEQPFMEASRAIGTPVRWQFARHLLPNLLGPIIVYTTLTVPQAILQESFLSFLGIGVKPPLPSWGNLAAEGLVELNTVRVRWWLILFPCVLLGVTLLALNFMGEGLREAFDPKRARK